MRCAVWRCLRGAWQSASRIASMKPIAGPIFTRGHTDLACYSRDRADAKLILPLHRRMVREAIANALPPPRKKVVGTGPVFQGANSEYRSQIAKL
jgi:hypothetical protein